MANIDILNISSIALQLAGFGILVHDLLPDYLKAKRKQKILSLVNFSKHINFLLESDQKKSAFYLYASYKEMFQSCIHECDKLDQTGNLNSKLYFNNQNDVLDRDKFRKYFTHLENEYKSIIEKIESTITYRNMYVIEAIIMIIIGYMLQMIGVMISARIIVL